MPALKCRGKLFGGIYVDALVVKLGRERVDELIVSGRGGSFGPSGMARPMKDWATVPLPADDWLELALEAGDRL